MASEAVTQAGAAGVNDGNKALEGAFDHVLKETATTLKITTTKGADLYALKQRPQ